MIKYLAITTTLFLSASAIAEDTLAFVGEAILAERSKTSCQDYLSKEKDEDGQLEEVCMDRVFKLRYEIKETLIGSESKNEVDFIGFYHYWGLPNYTLLKDALVVLRMSEHGYFLQGVEEVTKSSDGWVVCQEWDDNDEICKRSVSAGQYLTEAGFTFNKSKQQGPTAGTR